MLTGGQAGRQAGSIMHLLHERIDGSCIADAIALQGGVHESNHDTVSVKQGGHLRATA